MTGSTANHGRHGRPWQRIRQQVLREEPSCYWCGQPSTTVDHVIPLSKRPDLAHVRSNLRGCCRWCNTSKGTRAAPRRRRQPPRPTTSRKWKDPGTTRIIW
jgi:5-methylcytosine-specific restriction endonuclease McrA